jgi:hypothetical protein
VQIEGVKVRLDEKLPKNIRKIIFEKLPSRHFGMEGQIAVVYVTIGTVDFLAYF